MSLECGQPDSCKKGTVGEAHFTQWDFIRSHSVGTADVGAGATNDHVDTLSKVVCLADLKMDGNVS